MTGPEKEQILHRLTHRRRPWQKYLLIGLCVVVLANAVATGVAFLTIQNERAASIRRSCVDTNARHDRTIMQLDRLLRARMEGATTSEERDRLTQSRTSTVLLVEALVPYRNCELQAARVSGANTRP